MKFAGDEYRVLITLLDFADERGENCYPGMPALAAAADIGESTARRHVKSLQARGYVREKARGRGAKGAKSEYVLTLPEVPLKTERNSGQGGAQSESEYRSILSKVPLNSEQSTAQFSKPTRDATSGNKPLSDHYQIKEQIREQGAFEPKALHECADCSRAITGDPLERSDGRHVCGECPPF
ncbi:helix-turn-helix domain-containing protein [Mycobacterium paragordonae]|uniref:helix-turn-helix domain-containing protein n=1 Tax=Mycobacterium paragordonae TaxID=1389713 RepID=UPI0013C44BE0|nr:helix-turn-helix domain-containing protein [Mycobacterium paragordonae]